MSNDETNKIIANATVAIALSAAVQALVSFQQFNLNMKHWSDILGLVAVGISVIMIFVLAVSSYSLLKRS